MGSINNDDGQAEVDDNDDHFKRVDDDNNLINDI